jgi:hypothetical protein
MALATALGIKRGDLHPNGVNASVQHFSGSGRARNRETLPLNGQESFQRFQMIICHADWTKEQGECSSHPVMTAFRNDYHEFGHERSDAIVRASTLSERFGDR